jgi:predicted ester cyclase
MSSTTEVAMKFFEACEAGKGWEICKTYCAPNASFECQAEPLAEVRTLQAYTDWMQGLMKMMPDGRYDLKSFAIDNERNNVTAYAVFKGRHTGEGGPPPTGKSTKSTTSTTCISTGAKFPT